MAQTGKCPNFAQVTWIMGTGPACGSIESKFFPSQARLGVWVVIFRDFRTSILTCGLLGTLHSGTGSSGNARSRG